MGRVLLIALVLAPLLGCEGDPGTAAPTGGAGVPAEPESMAATAVAAHRELDCDACHSGPRGQRGRATVPVASCTSSGCHEDGGPQRVQVATVTFPHRDHGEGAPLEPSCAGCHTHDQGDEPLRAAVDACALCHISDVTTGAAEECRVCHQQPDHTGLTSQGIAVSHSQLPWVDVGCVRCHYDVADPTTEVSSSRCQQCHQDLAALNREAVGRDLHPVHQGLNCTSCHMRATHSIQAMSSAVELVCSDCHRQVHDLQLQRDAALSPATCAGCHTGVHAAQQQLVLGVPPGGGGATLPSAKFVAGITCRSCHVATAGAAADPTLAIRGTATSCAGCHEQEYTQVLQWWLDGIRSRLASSRGYVQRAAQALGPAAPDTALRTLDLAREMVELVAEAGGQHNLELSDRLLREAVDRAGTAYRLSGRAVPPAPDFGRVPHTGMCSYCHYSPDEPWDFEAMPEAFHESLVRRGR